MFIYTSKRSLQCTVCRFKTTSYNQSQTLFVYPKKYSTIKNMVAEGMVSNMTKNCDSCHSYTKHDEQITIEFPPKILVIVINRFDQVLTRNKNRDKIVLDRELLIASTEFILIGSVHHHGNTITPGHYTSNVFYPESAYTCNDSHIIPLKHLEPSDSVYMVFYAHKVGLI